MKQPIYILVGAAGVPVGAVTDPELAANWVTQGKRTMYITCELNRMPDFLLADGRRDEQLVPPAAPVVSKHRFHLTPKEFTICKSVQDGKPNKVIANELGTSEQVIKNYLRKVYLKSGLKRRLELAMYATHHGLPEPNELKLRTVQSG